MSEFSKFTITRQGRELIANVLAGKAEITFTRLVTTDEAPDAEGLEEVKQLQSIKQSQYVGSVEKADGESVLIKAAFSNKDLEEGYYIRAIGLYAMLADGDEILYGIAAETTNNCYMPAFTGRTSCGLEIQLVTAAGNADKVQVQIREGVYALAADLTALREEVELLKDTGSLKVRLEEARLRENIVSGETLSGMLGKVKKWLADLKNVAFTGSYADLTDVPLVGDQVPDIPESPSTRVNIEKGDSIGVIFSKIIRWLADIKNVAFTGSYNDLGNKPSALKNPKAIKMNGKTYDGSVEIDAGTLGVAYGGTGATDAAGARANLQAAAHNHNHTAAQITSGILPVARGGTGAADAAAARTSLGAAAASHNHSAADITSGTLPVARGGTGAVDAGTARKNLGLGAAATNAVANNLTTTAAGYVLDARQGKALKDSVNQINSDLSAANNNIKNKNPNISEVFNQSRSSFSISGQTWHNNVIAANIGAGYYLAYMRVTCTGCSGLSINIYNIGGDESDRGNNEAVVRSCSICIPFYTNGLTIGADIWSDNNCTVIIAELKIIKLY